MTINFTVPGRPIPQARPRVTQNGRRTYTPRRSVEYREAVALVAQAAMRGKEPLTGAVHCHIEFYFDIPKSYTCGKRLAAQYNQIKPVTRTSGDADNLAKGIMDALKGICWVDDSQVTRLSVWKRYTFTGAVAIVRITEDAENADACD